MNFAICLNIRKLLKNEITMTGAKEIRLLAKIGEHKYMDRLIEYGELYFRSIRDFALMDEGNGIGDKLETAVNYNCPPDPDIICIFSDGKEHRLGKGNRIQYQEHDSNKKGHIYCMSMVDFVWIDETQIKLKNPDDIAKMGDNYGSMVIIHNHNAFLQRVRQKIEKLGYSLSYKPVSYFPERDIVRKTVTPFDKRERYAYQNEFRILIDYYLKDPLLIAIGSIKDIATVVHAKLTP